MTTNNQNLIDSTIGMKLRRYLHYYNIIDVYLAVLILSISLSPEVPVRSVSSTLAITIRLEDILLVLSIPFWFGYTIRKKAIILPEFYKYVLGYVLILGLVSVGNMPIGDEPILRSMLYLSKNVEIVIIGIIVLTVVRSKRSLNTIIVMIVFGALLNAAWAFIQIITSNYGPLFYTAELGKWRYGTSLIGQPSVLASGGFYVPSLSLVTAVIIESSDKSKRVIYMLVFAVLFVALAGSVSRVSIMGAILGVISALILFGNQTPRYYLRLSFFGPPLILSLSVLPLPIYGRFYRVWDGITERIFRIWMPLLHDSFPEFFIGVGAGNLHILYGVTEAHNHYLRTLIIGGFLGLFIFCLMLVNILKTSYHLSVESTDRTYRIVSKAAFASTVSYSIMAIFQDAFLNVKISEMFWVVIGAMGAVYVLEFDQLN